MVAFSRQSHENPARFLMTAPFDLLIRNATVIDGTRAPRFDADIGVRDGMIEAIGPLAAARAAIELDARGKIAAPGFIDVHTHDDRLLLDAPAMIPKVSQGVTTVVTGNCGISLAPMRVPFAGNVPPPLDLLDHEGGWFRFLTFGDYLQALEEHPAALNAASLVGHTTLRVAAMEHLDRPANPAQIATMQGLARAALEAGAIGISTGTYYPSASAAPTEELIEVCRPLAELGGVFATHMRDEADGVMSSLAETFRIGRELGVPVIISHHKVQGRRNHGRSAETLAEIALAMTEQPLGLDCYPYEASSTNLDAARLALATRVIVTWSKPHPECAGRELDEIAHAWQVSPQAAAEQLAPAGAVYFSMSEADVQRILAFEPTMIGSDGLPHDATPHPRLWGTFPRVLGHYSRDLGLFPLETAVHKMTGLTAQRLGLERRGVLQVGCHADMTLFDADDVSDAATFADPLQAARGIETVIVNGVVVWRDGGETGARPGRVLRRA
jgi:N-acyl-D-amino-acid deacylase